MFQNFTERAQRVIVLSQEEARRLNQHVGTEHLLLGLIREGEGIAAQALASLGISLERVRQEVEKLIGIGSQPIGEIGLTPRAKRVIELSWEEALGLGHNYIGTEHLLLGLVKEGEGVAARVLTSLGIDLNRARRQVLTLLGGDGGSPATKNKVEKKSNTPTLDQFGRDLTKLAEENKIDPVIGREKEIERIIQILSRRTKNNPVLVGDPGVGKTAIAEGLAQRIVDNKVPEILKGKRVVSLDLPSMVAGTKYRGEFEGRMKKVMDEIRDAQDVMVFIDELHTIIGAGGAEGAMDAANILKPALARGEIQCIGATTLDEYRKHIEKDPALERRFQSVMVEEPTKEEAEKILQGLRDRYEAHHRVQITDEAIKAAVHLADRYISDRFLPDKAIDLIDEAASRVRLQSFTAPPEIKELEERLEQIRKEKEATVRSQEFEKAASLRDTERSIQEELQSIKDNWAEKRGKDPSVVVPEDIAQIVASWTGIPVKQLAEEESERLLKMEQILHERVIGQEEGVQALARAVRRARAGLKDPKRPIGSFIFLGPTGVGKTELARALAESLFGDEDAMIRLDMSEYMEKHAVSRLVGSPPGYVGYDEGGQLTEKVRRKPYSVVLFDEIEKAHPEVFNILLQVLEDGRLTDSKGRTVNFRNTVLIMTSNVGVSTIRREGTVGFKTGDEGDDGYQRMKDKVMDELKKAFRPEFLNRIDETIVFHPLDKEHLFKIIELMLVEVDERLREYGLKIDFTQEAKELLIEKGYDPEYGARPLRRSIQKLVEDEVSEEILKGTFKAGDTVSVSALEGKLVFSKL
jgi:ATP-dependent Clp protease ATP-binding subunit ClpC